MKCSDKTLVMAGGYYEHLAERGVSPVQGGERLEHCAWMCKRILTETSSFGEVKANRWLGFVQGWLVADGVFTIDECRTHSRSGSVNDYGPKSGKPFSQITILTILSGVGLPDFDIREVHSCCDQLFGGPILSDEIPTHMVAARVELIVQHPLLEKIDRAGLKEALASHGRDERDERIEICESWVSKSKLLLAELGYPGLVWVRRGGRYS